MPKTALSHFDEDVGSARAFVAHARTLPATSEAERSLVSLQLRSGWMYAVGALDAYFCDAYVDVLATTLSSKSRQPDVTLPEFVEAIKIPIGAILAPYARSNLRWRMAARQLMERENVLSLDAIKGLFNRFFRPGHKFFNDLLDRWMRRPDASPRLFAVHPTKYVASNAADQEKARRVAAGAMSARFADVFQRRHDCIHNCDRPRMRPQPIFVGMTERVLDDVEFLVRRFDEHVNAEFREFLVGIGCSNATLVAAGC